MQTSTNYIPKVKQKHAAGSGEIKAALEDIFGHKFFLPIQDCVKTLEDACEITGEDPKDKKFHEGRPKIAALHRLETKIKALSSEHEKLSFKNPNQKKWIAYFLWTDAGFRYRVSHYDYTGTDAGAGSGLCLPTEELSKYSAIQFVDDWNILLGED